MRRNVLNRYEREDDGTILIDVSATRVEDLYNNFDRNTPYVRRDLDPDLAEYLEDCARELGRARFVIRMTLVALPEAAQWSRVRNSVKSYFLYRVDAERRRIGQAIRRALLLFAIGFGLLFAILWSNRWLDDERTLFGPVFTEGLTVAAWVSLWEALVIFPLGWLPYHRNIHLYRRLAAAPMLFRSDSSPIPVPEKAMAEVAAGPVG